MNTQANEAIMFLSGNDVMTKSQKEISIKIRNATLKKFYENKIASLADRAMPLHLLRMMCQDVPTKNGDLESRLGRKWFVRKCIRHYQGKLKEIKRSERKGFFSFFYELLKTVSI